MSEIPVMSDIPTNDVVGLLSVMKISRSADLKQPSVVLPMALVILRHSPAVAADDSPIEAISEA